MTARKARPSPPPSSAADTDLVTVADMLSTP
jgi:hypothetical protein